MLTFILIYSIIKKMFSIGNQNRRNCMKKKWLSAIVAAALSVCVLTAPISVSNSEPTVAVLAASSARSGYHS